MTLREGYRLLGGDLRETLARLGDRALLMKYLQRFPDDDALLKLKTAVTVKNEIGVWQTAHTLRGTCATLGLSRLTEAVERVMSAGDWPGRELAMTLLEQEHRHAVAIVTMITDSDVGLAMLLHELRMPLQTILGTAEAQPDHDGMARIALSAKQLSALLAGVEACAANEPLHREPFSLAEALRDAVALVGADPPVSVRMSLCHARLVGDATGLTQVLLNLLTNALRHAPRTDRIALDATETDGEVIVTVRDHGPGMTEAERQSALTPYWQAKPGMGKGLGLPIAYALAERMGGTLVIDSAPGEGTAVTVRLPLAVSDDDGETTKKRALPRHFDGLRALLADDDRVGAEVSAELLNGLGLRTSVARDGSEAIQLARAGGYDCVFLDAHMPGPEAAKTIACIRSLLPDAPVFALTGGVLPEEEQQLRAAGLRECLRKPVSSDDLIRLLGRYFPDR